jgi:transposase
VATTKDGETTYLKKRFSTYTNSLRGCAEWLAENNCKDVCMESTGKYWIPVYNILEQSCNVTLAHPKYLKALRGKKTDNKDAQWISDVFKCDMARGSFIPPKDIRDLRELTRYNSKLSNAKTSEKNRFQNSLTVSNIQLGTVFSDVFGKSASGVLDNFLENGFDENADISPLINKHCKTPPEEIKQAINGNISEVQREKLKLIRSHLSSLDALKSELEQKIYELATPYQQQLDLLKTIPGVSDYSAVCILSEIGADIISLSAKFCKFSDSKNLCSWAGLAPQSNESGGKTKSHRTSHAGAYIKPILIQCSLNAVKSKQHPEFKSKFNVLAKRRGKKKAVIAICRMILTAIYFMFLRNEPYDSRRYQNNLEPSKNSVNRAVKLLQKLGYEVNSPPKT